MKNRTVFLLFICLMLFSKLLRAQCSHPDYDALMALYNSTDGPNWTDNSGWGDNTPGCDPCSWYGIGCDGNNRVICIDLDGAPDCVGIFAGGNNLTGTIPSQISELTELTTLILSDNNLNGSLPTELASLSNLEHLYLNANSLSGSIPGELGNLSNLQSLILSGNNLSGSIPSELGGLSNLQYLYLDANDLSSSIPSLLGNLSNLLELVLEINSLSGSIPTQLGNLSNLQRLDLSGNNINGSIPTALASLQNLLYLDLFTNQLSGSIPEELGSLSNLLLLSLSSNNLSGEIPSALGSLSNLQQLDIAFNNLSGSIPGALGNLSGSLAFLYLNNNNLSECYDVNLGNLCISTTVNLLNNPLLPWEGDFSQFCLGNNQVGATCDDGNSFTTDEAIQFDCSCTGSCNHPDYATLLAFYFSTNGPSWTNNSGWAEGALGTNCDPCSWYGVQCDGNNRVQCIDLDGNPNCSSTAGFGNNLSGSIPEELVNLENLQGLYLGFNDLSGCYPDVLSAFCSTAIVDLSNNPLLPWEGDFSQFCTGGQQIGAPCDDGNILTSNEVIQSDCSCAEVFSCAHPDLNALVILFNSTGGFGWTNNSGWAEGALGTNCDPCDGSWYGIQCQNGRVTCIDLDGTDDCLFFVSGGNNLVGEIPSAIQELTQLQFLYLTDNDLSGSIPNEIGALQNLIAIDLSNNNLSGSIPSELGNLSNLQNLGLSFNDLTGSIPTTLGNLQNLQFLYLQFNNLSGSIPTELGDLGNLLHLNLELNQLSGTIPSALGSLQNLILLDFSNNDLSGSIPSEIGNLQSLIWLDLLSNSLSGSIPTQLSNLINLQYLDLGLNNLSGSIPSGLGNLNNLQFLFLNFNNLSGTIPLQLGNLSNLTYLALNNNYLSGCYPTNLLNLCDVSNLDFSNNLLLPWQGDFSLFCTGNEQIGAFCDDSDSGTSGEVIQSNCDCGIPCFDYTVSLSPTSNLICEDETTTLTFSFSGGTPPYDITYSDGNSFSNLFDIENGHQITISPEFTSIYSIAACVDFFNCSADVSMASTTVNVLSPPNANQAGSISICDDGSGIATFDLTSLNITINGGTSNNVNWYADLGLNIPINNPGSFNSGEATLYATVSNVTCESAPVSVNLLLPQPPQPDILGDLIFCSGSSTTLDAGAGYTTYEWSNGGNAQQITVNVPGVYTVTVTDANNCTGTDDFLVEESTSLELMCAEQNPVSNPGNSDGEASISINGGTSPYQLNWSGPDSGNLPLGSPGSIVISDLLAGDYQLTVSDNNDCSAICNFSINEQNCNLDISNITLTNPNCIGGDDGSIELTTNGDSPPFTYDWAIDIYDGQEDLSGLNAGSYALTITDNVGCAVSEIFQLDDPAALLLDCVVNSIPSFPGANDAEAQITFAGGSPAYLMSWSGPVSGTQMEAVAGSLTLTNLEAGDYLLVLEDANGCSANCNFTVEEAYIPCDRASDSLVLAQIFLTLDTLDSYTWTNQWDLDQPMDTWYGVGLTAEGCVESLILPNNNMGHFMPINILNLPHLDSLDLSNNRFTGCVQGDSTFWCGQLSYAAISGNVYLLFDSVNEICNPLWELTCTTPSATFLSPDLDYLLDNPLQLINYVSPAYHAVGCIGSTSVSDELFYSDCGPDTLIRTYSLTRSNQGVVSTCSQELIIEKPGYEHVYSPADIVIACDSLFPKDENNLPHPDYTGYPEFDPVYQGAIGLDSNYYGLEATYTDEDLQVLTDEVVFLRVWTVHDTCAPGDSLTLFQNISFCASCRFRDSLALVELFNLTDGPNWTFAPSEYLDGANFTPIPNAGQAWNFEQPIDTWHGIVLSNEGCVEKVILNELGMEGNIPDVNLPNLKEFYCYSNALSGAIPDFSQIPELEILNCRDNALSESIPNFSNLPNLIVFVCAENNLTNSIPNFSNFPNLEFLLCFNNELSGSIPNFTSLPSLRILDCGNNQLNGMIPNFTGVPNLQSFQAYFNHLSGEVPDFSQLPNLVSVNLVFNNLSGILPDFSDNCPSLRRFYHNYNQYTFEGILPHLTENQLLINSNATFGSDSLRYAPQDSVFTDTLIIVTEGEELIIDLLFDELINSNQYFWYKNATPYNTILGNNNLEFPNISLDDAGAYWVHVTNENAPELTLESFTITIQVNPSPCEITNAIATGILCNGSTFYTEINIDHQDTDASFTLEGNGQNYGSFAYADLPLTVGPFSEDSLLYEFVIIDGFNPFCRDTVILATPFCTPGNDDCAGIIDLGIAPTCDGTTYRNLEATDSDIGFGNGPTCVTGGEAINDVWFAFTTSDTIFDYSISLTGIGGSPLTTPYIVLYRGDCEVDGLAELVCSQASSGATMALLQVIGLTPNTTYILRVGNIEMEGGNFQLCVEELDCNSAFSTFDYNESFCPGESVNINGTTYDEGNPQGTEVIVGGAGNGCDSIINVDLQYYQINTVPIDVELCPEGSTVIGGITYSANNLSGTSVIPGGDINTGCDLHLDVTVTLFENTQDTLLFDLCEGENVQVNGITYDENNPDGLQMPGLTINECDSLLYIFVTFHPVETVDLTQTLCPGENLVVNGIVYDESNPNGTEFLTTLFGCDSTIFVNLNFEEPASSNFSQTLCPGESVLINGTTYDESNSSGTETLSTANGCDSTVTILLGFYPEATTYIGDTLCAGETLLVNGTSYSELNPIGTEVLNTVNGCDSTININLSFFAPITNNFSPTFCPGESVEINGNIYNEGNPQGTEVLSGTGINGCDSTININLSFFAPIITDFSPTLCPGESVQINGNIYNESSPQGTEVFSGVGINGCDSTININLSFFAPITANFSPTLCPGESVEINGNTYDESNPQGTEVFSGVGLNGCDSTININLSFFAPITTNFSPTFCPGESVQINGTTYDESNPQGTEVFNGAGTNGCDSTIQVNLSFFTPITTNFSPTLCPGESVEINSNTYNESNPQGTEVLIGVAMNGCDSTININLSYFSPIITDFSPTLCPGESVQINGNTYDESTPQGTEVLIGAAMNGCDSTIQVNLSFDTIIQESIEDGFCEGTSYEFGGNIYTIPGIYQDTFDSSGQCDSIVTLTLSQWQLPNILGNPPQVYEYCEGTPPPAIPLQVSQGATINWYESSTGDDLIIEDATTFNPTAPGQYFAETINPITGCKNGIRFMVEVIRYFPAANSITITSCRLADVGIETIYLTTNQGCDSIITINTVYEALEVTTQSSITCDWTEVGLQTDTLTSIGGCDSIVIYDRTFDPSLIAPITTALTCNSGQLGLDTIPLINPNSCDSLLIINWQAAPVLENEVSAHICQGDDYLFGDRLLTESGTYYDTLTSSEGCDSLITLSLEVEQRFYEQNDAFCPGETYLFGDSMITEPGMYVQPFISQAGCDSIVTLSLTRIDEDNLSAQEDKFIIVQGGTSASLHITENDQVPGNDWFVELKDRPNHGMANLSPEGQLDYTLTNLSFLGVDSFSYQLCTALCPNSCVEANILISTLRDCLEEIKANLPNGFTPDGDGINDLFDPIAEVSDIGCLQNPQTARLTIVNRWSEVVYNPDVYIPWDGRSANGKLVPQGVYYFILRFELAEEVVLREVVHVLR